MSDGWPKILSHKTSRISPWVEIIAREVAFSAGADPQLYHSVRTADYVIILAVTPDGRVPLVRQYRPAIASFTLELPAGLLDGEENAEGAAARELLEETGYPAQAIRSLGANASDSGRLSNRTHSFFAQVGERISDFMPEPGVETQLVTPAELARLVSDGSFGVQMHLGVLLQANLRGLIKL